MVLARKDCVMKVRDPAHGGRRLGSQPRKRLEDMHLIRPDLQFAIPAGGADGVGQRDGVGREHLGAAGMDERRRQRTPARDVEGQPGVSEIHVTAVQPDQPGGISGADRRVAAKPFPGAGQLERQIHQW